jgi:hypothetical protein
VRNEKGADNSAAVGDPGSTDGEGLGTFDSGGGTAAEGGEGEGLVDDDWSSWIVASEADITPDTQDGYAITLLTLTSKVALVKFWITQSSQIVTEGWSLEVVRSTVSHTKSSVALIEKLTWQRFDTAKTPRRQYVHNALIFPVTVHMWPGA